MLSRVKLSLIIPTLNAGPGFAQLLEALRSQSAAPAEIIVIDSASADLTAEIARKAGARVIAIDRRQFGHGCTRNQAARQATGDILIFMTQDVMPADEEALQHLIAPIAAGEVAASYGRQIAQPTATPPEQFLRSFNYPPQTSRRTLADLPDLGVRTFFMSNAAAAVKRDIFEQVGGFAEGTILCEDMILCARLMRAGHAVQYAAQARFIHSHDYTLAQQFRRYFDYGVFIATDRDLLHESSVSGKGARFVSNQVRYLWRNKAGWWIPRTVIEGGLKFVAYQLGKRHRWWPLGWNRALSMHKGYWEKNEDAVCEENEQR